MTIFTTGATLRPVAIGSRAQLVALVHAVSSHRIRPVLDRVFPFDDAPDAFRHYLIGTGGRAGALAHTVRSSRTPWTVCAGPLRCA